jgi:molybdopterin synthase sulfur carrier subunit
MKIKVLFFAETKRVVGLDGTELNFDGVNISDLREILRDKFPSLSEILENSAFAVNKKYARLQTVLKEGDIVALIPPVEGG